jgi:hypothetical protein
MFFDIWQRAIRTGRKSNMFDRIDIRLTEPVCNCCDGDFDNANMEWGITLTNGGAGLQISCRECKTSISVPHKKFVGRIIYLNPSPNPKPKDKKRKTDNKDNVIQLGLLKKE